MADKKIETKSDKVEREYVIPLRPEWRKVSEYKRTNKAVKAVKEFLVRHMKIRDRDLNKIKVDKLLNEAIWSRGIKHPVTKIKVRAIKEGNIVRVELAELTNDMKFKKARSEKRDQKAREVVESKKSTMEKLKETAAGVGKGSKAETPTIETATEEAEKKEEAKEKEAATAEAEKKIEKEISKAEKHTTKPKSPKQEKNQQTGYNAVSRGR